MREMSFCRLNYLERDDWASRASMNWSGKSGKKAVKNLLSLSQTSIAFYLTIHFKNFFSSQIYNPNSISHQIID
jgi:hypothetical protein